MVDKSDIKQNLINLGLDEQEAIIFMELLKKSSMSILDISRAINIPRTNVYRICQKLNQKGFIEWVIFQNHQKAKAIKPESLKHLINEQKDKLITLEESLDNLTQFFNANINQLPKTEVRYYSGKEGFKQIIWNSLKAEKEVIGYSIFGRKEIVGDKFYSKYVQEFKLKKLKDKVITNEKSIEYIKNFVLTKKHQQDKDDIRIISSSKFYITGDISIYNNIYALTLWKGGEVVGIEIENSEIVNNQKSIFELLWDIAKPVTDFLP